MARLESSDSVRKIIVKEGEARIGEVLKELTMVKLTPQDLSNPVSLQMAISRIYSALLKSLEEGPKKRFMAEIRFNDDMGNTVVFAVDLGENAPPFKHDKVKARIIIELYEDNEE